PAAFLRMSTLPYSTGWLRHHDVGCGRSDLKWSTGIHTTIAMPIAVVRMATPMTIAACTASPRLPYACATLRKYSTTHSYTARRGDVAGASTSPYPSGRLATQGRVLDWVHVRLAVPSAPGRRRRL